jgi:diguanylate cyclase (GGDEF)-like protein/PAS domain S-box-containing protein
MVSKSSLATPAPLPEGSALGALLHAAMRAPEDAPALGALIDLLPQAVLFRDRRGLITFANPALCALVGIPAERILGRQDLDIFPAALAERSFLDDRRALETGESFETDYAGLSCAWPAVRVLRVPFRTGEGLVDGMHVVLWEISEQRLASEALAHENFLWKTLVNTLPDCIYFKDRDSRFQWVNQHMVAKFGAASVDELIGRTDFDVFTSEHAAQAFRDEQEIVRTGRPLVDLEEKETLPDGSVRWVATTKMPLRDLQGQIIGTFGVSRDITERKLAEERLARQAFYDSLTGLPNRHLFMDRLDHLLKRLSRRVARPMLFAVLTLDVDRFKGVNDGLGHQMGDQLLVQIARRLETCLRPGDTLARLGGDEFCVLLEDIRNEADATRVAERINGALAAPFDVSGTDVFASASLGIALSSSGYERPDEMLRDADTAMYRAKSNGRSRHEIFDAGMHRRAVGLLQIETDLRRALERDECRVYYQPIIDLRRGCVQGFEALLRWQHPQRGMVMPDLFIPVAEETGLIGPLGLWVLRASCRQMKAWQERLPEHAALSIAVNVSTRQIAQPSLVEDVKLILAETGLAATSLILEITESALMQNLQAGTAVMQRLHDLGVRLNIDDFGTGYSSLAYLQSFPVDTLKIDRSFIARLGGESGQDEIVRAIIALARSLRMSVTAEGVETAEQLAALQALDCASAQGFFFAPPHPAEVAEKLLLVRP